MKDFRESAASRASDDAERLLARRLCDLSERAARSGVLVSTGFLSPSEQEFCRMILPLLPCPPVFDGGFEGAERAVVCFGEYGERPITALRLGHKTPLTVSELPLEDFAPPERKTERSVVSLASPRLDALVAAAWGLSREDAQTQLARGLVQLNHRPTLDCSKQIREGDTVSLRGRGKLTVGGTLGESRRGRLRIEIEKYI